MRNSEKPITRSGRKPSRGALRRPKATTVLEGDWILRIKGDVRRRGKAWPGQFYLRRPEFARAVDTLACCGALAPKDRAAMRDGFETFLKWLEDQRQPSGPGRPPAQLEWARLWIALEGAARALRRLTDGDLEECRAKVRVPVVERAWFIAFGEQPPPREQLRKRLWRARAGLFAEFAASGRKRT